MNYPFRNAAIDFALGRIDAYSLRDFLIAQQLNYPKPMYYALMNLLGSHDVERIRSALACDVNIRSLSREEQVKLRFDDARLAKAVELEKLCAVLQFSIPGVPSIYYGDEQGMCGVCDPFNRLPFKEGERGLHDFYAGLARLRNENAVLQTGEVRFIAVSRDMLCVLRFDERLEGDVFLAVINRGESSHFTLDCSAAGLGSYEGDIDACSARIIKIR